MDSLKSRVRNLGRPLSHCLRLIERVGPDPHQIPFQPSPAGSSLTPAIQLTPPEQVIGHHTSSFSTWSTHSMFSTAELGSQTSKARALFVRRLGLKKPAGFLMNVHLGKSWCCLEYGLWVCRPCFVLECLYLAIWYHACVPLWICFRCHTNLYCVGSIVYANRTTIQSTCQKITLQAT